MAAERELSLIIRHMSGVDDAIVKYQKTIESSFPRNIKKVTASCFGLAPGGFSI